MTLVEGQGFFSFAAHWLSGHSSGHTIAASRPRQALDAGLQSASTQMDWSPRLGGTHRALIHYSPLLARSRTVVIGDFNDNARWDTATNPPFALTVGILADAGYVSLYHARTGEAHGSEAGGSLYWYRHRDRPYPVDYAFLPVTLSDATNLAAAGRALGRRVMSDCGCTRRLRSSLRSDRAVTTA